MGHGSIVGATRRAIHQSEWLESCPAWHVDDVPQHGPCECGADELNAYITTLEQEVTQKLTCIQVLAGGDEPNIVSDFPAANDVRALLGEKRRLEQERNRLRVAIRKATDTANAGNPAEGWGMLYAALDGGDDE
jgi:outer membrane murein-binding lipoprotein Lpp